MAVGRKLWSLIMAQKKKKRGVRANTGHLTATFKSKKLQLPEGYSPKDNHTHDDSFTSVRQTTYKGKTIRVETTYRITIDGESVRVHTKALDDGSVHSHAFPNYSFRSAMDLARKLVDFSEMEEPEDELGAHGPGSHSGHH
jgi:hypothetical protein